MPKILNFVKKIHYYSELFTSLLRYPTLDEFEAKLKSFVVLEEKLDAVETKEATLGIRFEFVNRNEEVVDKCSGITSAEFCKALLNSTPIDESV